MILQINEINENELDKLVLDSSHSYYIGKSREGFYSAIIRVDNRNEKIISRIIDFLMSYKS